MRRITIALAIGAAAVGVLSPSRAVMSGELKIGYVNLVKVFDNYERTKAADAELEKQGKQKDTELQARLNELKKMREGLELLNEQAREAKTREIGRERQKLADTIFVDIQRVIDDYAKANGFSLILQKEKAVLYGEPAYDVTDEIMKLLNSRAQAAGH